MILDEVLLILGGGVDGRTLSGLGLLTTGHGEPGAGEHSWLAMSGGEKPKTAQGPPINASSKDEENFVQYVTEKYRGVV
jgi:hypothetical protein